MLNIEIVGLIDHASKCILLKFRVRCIQFSFNFYMDPPSLPSDIKHSYCAQTLHVFFFQNVFGRISLFCVLPRANLPCGIQIREKNQQICAGAPPSVPGCERKKEIKRNLVIICIVHFLNAKKCSITRIING